MKFTHKLGAFVLTLLFCTLFATAALAQSELFSVSVAGLQDGVPFPGDQGVSVKGQNKPTISITSTPQGDTQGFSQFELWIDDSRKTQWTDGSSAQTYSWQLCSAGMSSGNRNSAWS